MIELVSMSGKGSNFRFKKLNGDIVTQARIGVIHTPHGDIETPAFVPVGTQATVKTLTPEEIASVGTRLFFVNTYHMYLRPGIAVVKAAGGLHSFMGWDGPIITDSGGFQVFSLGRRKFVRKNEDGKEETSLVSISEDGVEFQSHWDGSKHLFTPERSMQYQWNLGSDIHIAFDDCTPYGVSKKDAEASMERTHRWAERSLREHKKLSSLKGKPYQALYGSIQGSVFEDLRIKSTKYITSLDFDGIAIGGVAVGESKVEMKKVLDWVTPLLPSDKPRHLLGVGELDDIYELIAAGMDTFDCVQPTRLARMGIVYVHSGSKNQNPNCVIDLTKAQFGEDFTPIEKGCTCYTCTHFTRAYIHHLFHVRELLAYRLATIHNIFYVNRLVFLIRESIKDGSFGKRYASFIKGRS